MENNSKKNNEEPDHNEWNIYDSINSLQYPIRSNQYRQQLDLHFTNNYIRNEELNSYEKNAGGEITNSTEYQIKKDRLQKRSKDKLGEISKIETSINSLQLALESSDKEKENIESELKEYESGSKQIDYKKYLFWLLVSITALFMFGFCFFYACVFSRANTDYRLDPNNPLWQGSTVWDMNGLINLFQVSAGPVLISIGFALAILAIEFLIVVIYKKSGLIGHILIGIGWIIIEIFFTKASIEKVQEHLEWTESLSTITFMDWIEVAVWTGVSSILYTIFCFASLKYWMRKSVISNLKDKINKKDKEIENQNLIIHNKKGLKGNMETELDNLKNEVNILEVQESKYKENLTVENFRKYQIKSFKIFNEAVQKKYVETESEELKKNPNLIQSDIQQSLNEGAEKLQETFESFIKVNF